MMTSIRSFVRHILDLYSLSSGPSVNVLVMFAVLLLAIFLIRLMIRRHRIRISRAAFPLVIGGWGTRGKSGMERKKAALFQALGFNIVSKTTGCEATLIHAEPGLDATEIPIYRPGNKASIWEQERVMRWGRYLNAEVFLWECMALAPDYAELMQSDWMHDDYATLSNTFLDHDNIQGPTGTDVTRSLAAFIPENAVLYTAEESMLPILERIAKKKNTRLISLSPEESALFGDDVLALFPYNVHPRNLGLVIKMAADMGIDSDFALCEIARNIRPDLGAFKRFTTTFRGRRLEFWNGMSANDEVSCLNNWRNAGFDTYHPDQPEWIVTVVNNRDDRILRSREFAEILVRYTPAHRHFLIGTNLNGLQGYLRTAFNHYLHQHPLIEDTPTKSGDTLYQQLVSTVDRELFRLRVEALSLPKIVSKLNTMMESAGAAGIWNVDKVNELWKANVFSEKDLEPYFPQTSKLSKKLKQAIRHQLLIDLADYSDIIELKNTLKELTKNKNYSISQINHTYRRNMFRIFNRRFIRIDDPSVSGDAIIDFIVRRTPPGYSIKIMGMQNIKGTGLDFAYRWISLDKVQKAISDLDSDDESFRLAAAQRLAGHDDYGILDAPLAIDALKSAVNHPRNNSPEINTVLNEAIKRVTEILENRTNRLKTRSPNSYTEWIVRFWLHLREADFSKKRFRKTKRILEDLFAKRISHARASAMLHNLVKEQEK